MDHAEVREFVDDREGQPMVAWLYGSHARGTATVDSDVDVLVVADDTVARRTRASGTRCLPATIRNGIEVLTSTPSVSAYSWSELLAMAEYGSLFIRHLQLEARPIHDPFDDLPIRLGGIRPYTRGVRDVRGFQRAVADSRAAVALGGDSRLELAMLGTVFRHAAVVGCYLLGQDTYDRRDTFSILVAAGLLDRSLLPRLERLHGFKLWMERGAVPPSVAGSYEVVDTCGFAADFLRQLLEAVHDHDRRIARDDRDGAQVVAGS